MSESSAIATFLAARKQPRRNIDLLISIKIHGVVRKSDDVQGVAWVLAANERVERDRHFLGRQEAAAQEHRPAHIDQDPRRSSKIRRRTGSRVGTGCE